MKVIAHIERPDQLRHVNAIVEWATKEPQLKDGAAVHTDNAVGVFRRLPTGTIVVHIQTERKESA